METIEDARQYIADNREKGVDCPCCGKYLKVWRKSIVSTSAAELIRLVGKYRGEAIHIDDFCIEAKDRNFSQLVLWGLVVPEKNDDRKKRSPGRWIPTAEGKYFARGLRSIDKYVLTYDNHILKFEGPKITIRDALNNKFDYEKLLMENNVFPEAPKTKLMFGEF